MSQTKPSQTLRWWIVVFVSVVIIIHSLLQLGLLLSWRATSPFSVWDLLLAIIGSEIVAILAGAVTIVVSWRMTQHFGEESTESIASEVRQAMSTTIPEKGAFLSFVAGMVDEAIRDPDSLLVASFSTASLPGGGDIGDALGRLVAADARASVAVPTPNWLEDVDAAGPTGDERKFWEAFAKAAKSDHFVERFAKRRAFVIPLPADEHSNAACLLHKDAPGRYRVVAAASGNESGAGHGAFIGAITKIDEAWGGVVLRELCDCLQEPKGAYARSIISHNDVLKGIYTGLGTTRSIITTQFLLGCESVLHISPTTGGMRTLPVSLPDGHMGQFEYSPEQFLPPAFVCGDHSGSLLGQLVWQGKMDVRDKVILEIGCGPGYVTTIMSKKCGSGRVIALDIGARALEIAEANVKRNGRPAVVSYVRADANDLAFTVSGGALGIDVSTQAGTSIADGVNMVLVDLPLLPFSGNRALSSLELPYLESVDAAAPGVLPSTILRVLGALATPIRDVKGEVILPVCAGADDELTQVESEVRGIMGGCVIDRITASPDGFVHCLRVKCQ